MSTLPTIAVPIFPGSNGECDNVATLRRTGFQPLLVRWNQLDIDTENIDGYFLGAGFTYEDRGRSGMIAARDAFFQLLHAEDQKGKIIIGNCNGAQMLVESGLVPFGDGLALALAHNAVNDGNVMHGTGFLNEWVFLKRTCAFGRCATAYVDEILHVPMAHGEGRFTCADRDLFDVLKKNDQIVFSYCNQHGEVSEHPSMTPNGSYNAIAAVCNERGNVVALMPHPERTSLGDAYFYSLHHFLRDKGRIAKQESMNVDHHRLTQTSLPTASRSTTEIFIASTIINNEERSIAQAVCRILPNSQLSQYRYIGILNASARDILSHIRFFNPHKERAIVYTNGQYYAWNAKEQCLHTMPLQCSPLQNGIALLKRDQPDLSAATMPVAAQTGVVSMLNNVQEEQISAQLCEIFSNPHSSTLSRLKDELT